MAYCSQAVRDRGRVLDWILSQPEPPNRKTVRKAFPDVPVKIIRAALQAAKAQQ